MNIVKHKDISGEIHIDNHIELLVQSGKHVI